MGWQAEVMSAARPQHAWDRAVQYSVPVVGHGMQSQPMLLVVLHSENNVNCSQVN